jgi:hypothetical protein
VAKVQGLQKTTDGIRAAGRRYRKGLELAVTSEAEAILTEAKILVPQVTGNLLNSHRLTVRTTPTIFAIIEFLAPYARRVHEEPRPQGSNGTFKYLEQPLREASSGYAERVAAKAARFAEGG